MAETTTDLETPRNPSYTLTTGEGVTVSKHPEMTADHRLRVVLLQRQILALQVNIHNAQKQLETLSGQLPRIVEGIANDLKVDVEKYSFDIDNLVFVPKENK